MQNPFKKKSGVKFGPAKVTTTGLKTPAQLRAEYDATAAQAAATAKKKKPKVKGAKAWYPSGPTSNGKGVGF